VAHSPTHPHGAARSTQSLIISPIANIQRKWKLTGSGPASWVERLETVGINTQFFCRRSTHCNIECVEWGLFRASSTRPVGHPLRL